MICGGTRRLRQRRGAVRAFATAGLAAVVVAVASGTVLAAPGSATTRAPDAEWMSGMTAFADSVARLSGSQADGSAAAVSTEPGRIVYSLETAGTVSDVWSIKPGGTDLPMNVTKNDRLGARAPDLSPNGTKITFAATGSVGTRDVHVINADGTGLPINLTSRFAGIAATWDPSWSPDGTKIAFRGSPLSSNGVTPKTEGEVYVVNADGSGVLDPLTSTSDDVQDVAWSPVDDRIAFTRKSDGALYTVRSNRTEEQRVFLPSGLSAAAREPAWSPDGTKLAFEYHFSSQFGCTSVIATVNSSNGSDLRNLTTLCGSGTYGPSWSPDGTEIVFVRTVTGHREELFRISAATGEAGGGARVPTTPEPFREQEPDWGSEAAAPPPAATETALSSSANPSVSGQQVTYTATVTSTSGTPSGTVAFTDGGTTISGCGTQSLSGGQATCATTYAAPGTHAITAAYTPNTSDLQPSTSSVLTQIVNKAATTTQLEVSPNPAAPTQEVTLTATVGVNTPGSGTPTGTVTFLDGTAVLGTGTLDGPSRATLRTSSLSPGTHSLTASYAGNDSYLASTSLAASMIVGAVPGAPTGVSATAGDRSATVSWSPPASNGGSPITGYVITPYIGTTAQTPITVSNVTSTPVSGLTNGTTYTFRVAARNAIGTGPESTASNPVTPAGSVPTQTALSSSANPSVSGQLVRYTATVTSDAGTPTGTVAFTDGGVGISGCGSRPLSGGVATCEVTYAAPGTHSIRAAYTPSSSDLQPSTSSVLTQTVNKAATTTRLEVSPNPTAPSQEVTLTATVTMNAPGSGTPTGTVTFFDGTTVLGTRTLDGSGRAILLTSSLSPGTHSLTASYGGNGSCLASTSLAASLVVGAVPGAPIGVSATAGDRSATVSWSPPASNGGSPITGYVVTPYVGTTALTPITVSNVTSTPVSGLTNGTTYTFRIAARNAIGTGPQSAASNAVTPASATGTLSVTLNGQGRVTSIPAGIDCGGDCSMPFPVPLPIGYSIRLTAVPAPGWAFYGWTDTRATSFSACSGTNPVCDTTLPSAAVEVPLRASFYRLPAPGGAGADGPGKIVYRLPTDAAGHGDVWIVNPDGSDRRKVTNNADLFATAPVLSPNGRQIAFANRCPPTTCYLDPSANLDLYVVNTDGTGLTNVTERFGAPGQRVRATYPTWSPDGTRLAFSGSVVAGSGTDIYVTNSSTLTRVTNVGDAQFADWSPISGDNRILFARNSSGNRGLWTVRSDGAAAPTPIRPLPQTPASAPRWSPDGTRIVFESLHGDASTGCVGFGHVFTVLANGTNLTDLAPKVCTNSQPSWSPDGTRLVFTRNGLRESGHTRDLFVMDAVLGDAGNLARITSTVDPISSLGELEPDWGTAAAEAPAPSPPPPAPPAPPALTAPDAPAGVIARAGNGSASVSWSPPAGDGGSPITGYVVTPYIGTRAQAPISVGNVTSTTISGLRNGTTYTFTVAAQNSVGTGPESAPSNAVMPTAPKKPAARKCVVPRLLGLKLSNAKKAIRRASCRVGTVTFVASKKKFKNRVVGQRPAAGKKLKAGANVKLTVGRGPR
jgi:Tol biopolymer transport system component